MRLSTSVIADGLELLRKYYTLEECPSDPVIANPRIAGREHRTRRFFHEIFFGAENYRPKGM